MSPAYFTHQKYPVRIAYLFNHIVQRCKSFFCHTIYYLQYCIDEFPLDYIINDAINNLASSAYTAEDMYNLELRYITLKEDSISKFDLSDETNCTVSDEVSSMIQQS